METLPTLRVGLAVDFLGNMGYTVLVYMWSYAHIGCFAMINLENSAFFKRKNNILAEKVRAALPEGESCLV